MNPQSISGSCKEGLDCVCSRNDALASWVTISMRLGAWFFRKKFGGKKFGQTRRRSQTAQNLLPVSNASYHFQINHLMACF